MARVNRAFKQVCADQSLWKRLYHVHVPLKLHVAVSTNWRTLLRDYIEEKRRREQQSQDELLHRYRPFNDNVFNNNNPYIPVGGPPGMYGGDYDRFPNFGPTPGGGLPFGGGGRFGGGVGFFPPRPRPGYVCYYFIIGRENAYDVLSSGLIDPSAGGFPPGSIVPGARFDPVGPFGNDPFGGGGGGGGGLGLPPRRGRGGGGGFDPFF